MFSPMWAEYDVKIKHPNGTIVEIGAHELLYPERKNYLSVEIEIPQSVLPRDQSEWDAEVALIFQSIARMIKARQGKSLYNKKMKRLPAPSAG